MVTWITILFQLIALAPKGLELLERLLDLMGEWVRVERQKRTEADLAEAIKKSKDTKDTSDLENLFPK